MINLIVLIICLGMAYLRRPGKNFEPILYTGWVFAAGVNTAVTYVKLL